MAIWMGSEDTSDAIYRIKHEGLDEGRGHNALSSNSIQQRTARDGQSHRDSLSKSKHEL